MGSLTYVKFQWKKAANNNFDCFYCVKTICWCDHIFVFWNSFWDRTSFFPLQPNKLWTQTGKNHFTTFDFSFWLFKIQNVSATFRECCCFLFWRINFLVRKHYHRFAKISEIHLHLNKCVWLNNLSEKSRSLCLGRINC